jgi:hypothetical protein
MYVKQFKEAIQEHKKEQILFTCPNPDCLEINGFNLMQCEACFKAHGKQ